MDGIEREAPVQGYSESFARIYNIRWTAWVTGIAPLIAAYYETLPISAANKLLLDVCCGTGQLLTFFLDRGYSGTGLDSSEHMLKFARKNAGRHLRENRVDFIRADAADFRVKRGYGLAVSTFDALNHLSGRSRLSACFSCVKAALAPGGCFLFDLNTSRGLGMWNGISVEDTEELFIINRGIFEESLGRAYHKTTGFIKTAKGAYERFEQTAYNTLFRMQEVKEDLTTAGFVDVRVSTSKDFAGNAEDPETLTRAFFVARVQS